MEAINTYTSVVRRSFSKNKKTITYQIGFYKNNGRYFSSSLYIKVDQYTKEEIDFLESLLGNINDDHYRLIKAIIHGKHK